MKQHLSKVEIQKLDRFYRMHLMNTLPGIKNASMIGTKNQQGLTNLAIFNSVVHLGAHPPLLGFILRPITVHRQTYANLKSTGAFTINMVTRHLFRAAHQTSAKYGRDVSEFEATGLTPFFSGQVAAPYVAESPVRIGLTFAEEQHIKSNDTWLIIGAVEEIFFPAEAVLPTGQLALEKLGTVGVSGLDSYFSVSLLERLGYARPE